MSEAYQDRIWILLWILPFILIALGYALIENDSASLLYLCLYFVLPLFIPGFLVLLVKDFKRPDRIERLRKIGLIFCIKAPFLFFLGMGLAMVGV